MDEVAAVGETRERRKEAPGQEVIHRPSRPLELVSVWRSAHLGAGEDDPGKCEAPGKPLGDSCSSSYLHLKGVVCSRHEEGGWFARPDVVQTVHYTEGSKEGHLVQQSQGDHRKHLVPTCQSTRLMTGSILLVLRLVWCRTYPRNTPTWKTVKGKRMFCQVTKYGWNLFQGAK